MTVIILPTEIDGNTSRNPKNRIIYKYMKESITPAQYPRSDNSSSPNSHSTGILEVRILLQKLFLDNKCILSSSAWRNSSHESADHYLCKIRVTNDNVNNIELELQMIDQGRG